MALADLSSAAMSAEKLAASRFISLAPNITETVVYFGGLQKLVAVTNDCDYPDAVKNLPKIGKYTYPDLEKIIALQPAVVLLESTADPRFKDKLRDLRIDYREYNFTSLRNYFAELRRLSADLDLDAADKIEDLNKLWQKNYPALHKKAAIIVWQNPPIAAGRDTFLADFFASLGCQNIISRTARYPELSPEQLYQADIIINLSGRPWTLTSGQQIVEPETDLYLRLSPRLIQARGEMRNLLANISGGWSADRRAAALRDYRWLRLVLALLVGAGLALSGLLYQSMLSNPLAEPYLLGVSSGAAVGALGGLLFNCPPFFTAVLGALLALTLVYLLARKQGKIDNSGLILSGVMINAFCGALIMLSVFFAGDKVHSLMFWLMGDLGTGIWPQAWLIGAVLLVMTLFASWQSGKIELLSVGDEQAESLGVEVSRLKTFLLFLLSALTAVIVASTGIIGFVGLIIPHIVKMLFGERLGRNIFLTLFCGAVFLALSDLAARTVLPEIILPVGIITALLGVPFFVLVYKKADGL
ncbi:MAG: helical backbone metal receptor [Candidatus Margulisbacteria bacterium]|nr:helical backbone metal receptor [Candidatus Margulisiibacteriota bacterium]